MQILVSIGINYPVLREDYVVLQKPLLIITGTGNMETVISFLSGKNTPKLNEYLNIKKVMAILNDVNSDFVIYPYVQSQKGNDFLEIIASIVTTGGTSSNSFNAVPVVVAENIPYGYNIDHFFIICIDEWSDRISFDRLCVVPPEEELSVIYDKFNSYSINATHDENAFLAAACFLYPYFKDKHLYEEFQDVLDCAKKLVELDEDSHSLNDIGDFFVNTLYKWQKNTSFHNIYMLPELEMSVIRKLNQVILFDEKYIYMKECFFKKISAVLLNTFHLTMLKKALVDDCILCPDNTNTYTVKMAYCNIIGEYKRERMLRFSRKKLDKIGEPSFVEMCMNRKGKKLQRVKFAEKKGNN